MAKEKAKIKQYTRPTDHLFMTIVYAFCAIALIAILIPLIFVVAASFSSPDALLSAKVFLWPVDFTLRGYKMVFDHDLLPLSFWNSIVYTVVGTVINLVLTVLAAYPLSRKDLAARNPIMMLFAFTMLFNGGMIPTYLLVRDLGMLDTDVYKRQAVLRHKVGKAGVVEDGGAVAVVACHIPQHVDAAPLGPANGRGPGGVQPVGGRHQLLQQGFHLFRGARVGEEGLVAHAPHHNAGMVPVGANHLLQRAQAAFLKLCLVLLADGIGAGGPVALGPPAPIPSARRRCV